MSANTRFAQFTSVRLTLARFSATRFSATRFSATRFSATRFSATRFSATRFSAPRFSPARLLVAMLAPALLLAACSSDPSSASGGGAGHDASAAGAGNGSGAAGTGGLAGGGSGGLSALCGNGQVDPGETCDEAALTGGQPSAGGASGSSAGGSSAGGSGAGGSSAGGSSAGGSSGAAGATDAGAEVGRCVSLAACPPASNACVRPVIAGSAATCDARCAEAPVTTCRHGDGCCAPGCAPNEDNDCAVWSCDPSAPLGGAAYASMESLSKDALRSALSGLVSGHTALGYDSARDYMFNTLDVHDGHLECVYTGRLVPPDGTRIPGGFNTEHSWPQSDGASSAPANSDLHHLFPSDSIANSARANWPFGETLCQADACSYFGGGSELGEDAQGQTVFQVRTERQGDIARAHFYFSVRYHLPIDAKEEATLRQWHCADPPDALERARNDGIEAVQHNRNPFVDRPDFAQRLIDF